MHSHILKNLGTSPGSNHHDDDNQKRLTKPSDKFVPTPAYDDARRQPLRISAVIARPLTPDTCHLTPHTVIATPVLPHRQLMNVA
jgi:hypothetical protein